MIEYEALAGYSTPVRFVVSTAVLPVEVVVTGVRLLMDVEVLPAEIGTQLRTLRPAIEALGEAYSEGHVPIVEAVDDVAEGTRSVGGIVLAPVSAVRDVLFGSGGVDGEGAEVPVEPEPPADLPDDPEPSWRARVFRPFGLT